MIRGGCKFGYGKTRDCPLSKKPPPPPHTHTGDWAPDVLPPGSAILGYVYMYLILWILDDLIESTITVFSWFVERTHRDTQFKAGFNVTGLNYTCNM